MDYIQSELLSSYAVDIQKDRREISSLDDDSPRIYVDFYPIEFSEGDTIHVIIRFMGVSTCDHDVWGDYETFHENNASTEEYKLTDDGDYYHIAGSWFIPAGVEADTVGSIIIIDDEIHEEDEVFYIEAFNIYGNYSGQTSAGNFPVIEENDPKPNISVGNTSVVEGETASFSISKDKQSSLPDTIYVSTSNGSATGGNDYQILTNHQVIIPAMAWFVEVPVATYNDSEADDGDTFNLEIIDSGNRAIITDPIGVCTIKSLPAVSIAGVDCYEDVDSAIVEIRLNHITDTDIFGTFYTESFMDPISCGDIALPNDDYVHVEKPWIIPAGDDVFQLKIKVVDDDLDEPIECVKLHAEIDNTDETSNNNFTALLRIFDNDTVYISVNDILVNEGNIATFTLSLDRSSWQALSVTVNTGGGDATAAEDYNPLSGYVVNFGIGETEKPVNIPTLSDDLDEDDETFNLYTSNPNPIDGLIIDGAEGICTIEDNYVIPVTVTINTPFPACVGSGATLTSVVTGADESASYQWYKNDLAISGQTSGSTTISDVQTSMVGDVYKLGVTPISGEEVFASYTITGDDIADLPDLHIDDTEKATCYLRADGEVFFTVRSASTNELSYEIKYGTYTFASGTCVVGEQVHYIGIMGDAQNSEKSVEVTDGNGCKSKETFTIVDDRTQRYINFTSDLPCNLLNGDTTTASFLFAFTRTKSSSDTYDYEILNSNDETVSSGTREYDGESINDDVLIMFPYTHGESYRIHTIEADNFYCYTEDTNIEFDFASYNVTMNTADGIYYRNSLGDSLDIFGTLSLAITLYIPNPDTTYTVQLYSVDGQGTRTEVPFTGYTGGQEVILPPDLPAGDYELQSTVSGTAWGSCTSIAEFTVVDNFVIPTATINSPTPTCVGSNKQLQVVTTEIDETNASYQWYKNGVPISGETLNVLTVSNIQPAMVGDIYMVEVTPLIGAMLSANDTIKIEDIAELPQFTIDSTLITSCFGSNDGEVLFTVNSASTPGFDYEIWTTAGNSATGDGTVGTQEHFVGLFSAASQPGNGLIEITDGNGCISHDTISVGWDQVSKGISCISDLPCNLANGETAVVSFYFEFVRSRATSSTYDYSILNSSDVVVSSGTQAYDAVGSSDDVLISFTYTQGESYRIQTNESTSFSCFTDAIDIPTPNVGNYSIALNEASGVYIMQVGGDLIIQGTISFAANSCSPNANPSYSMQLFFVDDEGVRTEIPVSGYTGGEIIDFPTDLAAGNYEVEVTVSDAYYGVCTASTTFTIISTTSFDISLDIKDVTCFGGSDGSAVANVSGGVGPYQYRWYDSNDVLFSSDPNVTGLVAGDYYLMLSDLGKENFEPERFDFTIEDGFEMGDISVALPNENSANCEVAASISNAVEGVAYTFRWVRIFQRDEKEFDGTGIVTTSVQASDVEWYETYTVPPGSTTAVSTTTLNEIPTGDYYIFVRDENGCEQSTLWQTTIACEGHTLGSTFPISTPEVTRNYDLCVNWKTYSIEVTPDTFDYHIGIEPGITALEIGSGFTSAAIECKELATKKAAAAFDDLCLSIDNLDDEVSIQYDVESYHWTLYYFDRAGNLVKTVPPKGVNPLTGGDLSRDNFPAHTLVTSYKYNSLGQMIRQETPDGGITNFMYNNSGQIRFSQNAQQEADGLFSYTKYDALSRVREVGECSFSGSGYSDFESLRALMPSDGLTYQELPFEDRFPTGAQNTSEQTITYYSEPTSGILCNGQTQKHLLNRVSHTQHFNEGEDPVNTYYSYDAHGNVEWMVQDIPGVKLKTLAYEYDLISGNVKQVAYNQGEKDQFFHKYQYDEDNRIQSVETSVNGVVWESDARYEYYKHGPLKRTELGEDRVQGLDYVYTLQGWLKAINHPGLSIANDPGSDGSAATGHDVFGMVLSYFDGDFVNSASVFDANASTETKPQSGRDLFNGNIGAWTHQTAQFDNDALAYNHLNGQQFVYDKLNRIKNSSFVNGNSGEFESNYSYDPNGNLLTLNRNASGATETEQSMDRLSYSYYNNTNRLQNVADAVTDNTKWDEDIDNQTSTNNYTYDNIGNLTSDEAEGITNIEWTVSGKVRQVSKADGSTITFSYDAQGNRVRKEILNDAGFATVTYYVRDAQGNIMSVYNETEQAIDGGGGVDKLLNLSEQPIYGSSRIGTRYGEQSDILQTRRFPDGADPYYIENETTTFEAFQSNWQLPIDNGTSTILAGIDMTGGQPQLGEFSHPIGAANFNPVSSVSNNDGELQFTFVVADTLNNVPDAAMFISSNGFYMRYAGELRNQGVRTLAKAGGVAMCAKLPDSENKYVVLTVATDQNLYAHSVDMSLPGFRSALGMVTAKNQLLANGPFLDAMLVVTEQKSMGGAMLLAYMLKKNSETTATLQIYGIDSELTVQLLYEEESPLEMNTGLPVKLAMAPNGKHLALTVHKGSTTPGFGLVSDGAETRIYAIDNETRLPEFDRAEFIEGELLVNSTAWGDDNQSYYYATSHLAGGYQLHRGNGLADNAFSYPDAFDKPAALARGSANKLFVNVPGNTGLQQVAENTIDPALDINKTLTGSMPMQAQKITFNNQDNPIYARALGNKVYELTDHLGNVRATISDRLVLNSSNNTYEPELISYSNYYPFGSLMPNQNYSTGSYRFGFNGKEKDQQGEFGLTHYDYGFRIYNPGIARFLSVDPLTRNFPSLTPYQYASDSPIQFIDLDGLEGIRPPRAATNSLLNNRIPPSVGRTEYTRYNPISRNNQVNASYLNRESLTAPVYSNGNVRGRNIVAATKGFEKFVKYMEKIQDISYTKSSKGLLVNTADYYRIEFSSPEAEIAFNRMELEYKNKLEKKISKIERPETLGKNPTQDDREKFNKESLIYMISKLKVKVELGPSPGEQLIKNIEDNQNFDKDVKVKEKQMIYATPIGL